MNAVLKENAMKIIDSLIADEIISASDLANYNDAGANRTDPEHIRREMENWYITLGIEELIGHTFRLNLPYFTESEINEAYQKNEMIMCLPKGLTKKMLGTLFNLQSWAITDELVADKTEASDFWFMMKMEEVSEYLDSQGREIRKIYEKEEKLQLTLERYMVYIARMRYLYRKTPDTSTKTWLVNSRYEKKAMLIAGFDSKSKFSIHAWMPNFHSPYVGGRYVKIVDHHYI